MGDARAGDRPEDRRLVPPASRAPTAPARLRPALHRVPDGAGVRPLGANSRRADDAPETAPEVMARDGRPGPAPTAAELPGDAQPIGNFLHPARMYFPPSAWMKSEAVLRQRLAWLQANGYTIELAMLEQTHWGVVPDGTASGHGRTPRRRSCSRATTCRSTAGRTTSTSSAGGLRSRVELRARGRRESLGAGADRVRRRVGDPRDAARRRGAGRRRDRLPELLGAR